MLTITGKALGKKKPLFEDFSIPFPPDLGEGRLVPDSGRAVEETSTTEQGISNGWHKVVWGTAGLYRSPCGSVAGRKRCVFW